jgi:hypothetical protein
MTWKSFTEKLTWRYRSDDEPITTTLTEKLTWQYRYDDEPITTTLTEKLTWRYRYDDEPITTNTGRAEEDYASLHDIKQYTQTVITYYVFYINLKLFIEH